MISLSLALTLSLSVAPQDSHLEFRSQFKKAMDINSSAQMAQLVKRNQEEAVSWIIQTAESISQGSSEELATRMTALRSAWKTSMETGFASKMEEYFSLLEPALLRERGKLKAKYDDLNKEYWDNMEAKEGPKFTLIGEEFKVVAGNFSKVGDHYYSSQSWAFYGICFGKETRGDKANLFKAYEGASKCVEERLLIELKDRFYLSNRQTADHLKANGFDKKATGDAGGEAGPGAGPGARKAPKASGEELIAPLSFQAIEEPDDFIRPSYFADQLYVIWNAISLGKKESAGKISNLGDLSPKVMRTASSAVTIDVDGDGEGDPITLDGKAVPDGKVSLTGNMRLVQFKVGEGAEQREWACHLVTGLEKDLFQGFERGMGIYDQSVQVFHFNAASLIGEIGGEDIQVLDDNSDGIYGSPPVPWEYAGVSKGNFHREMDSVRIGSSKRARPWSQYQQVGDGWYKMAVNATGSELIANPVAPEVGKLKLKYTSKGGKPTWVILRGKGIYEESYFDLLANGSKGIEVPVGNYELFQGEVRKGKGRQTVKALMVPGEGMAGWTVTAGETTTVELGLWGTR